MNAKRLAAGAALAALAVGIGYVGLAGATRSTAVAGVETAAAAVTKVDDFMLADQDFLAYRLHSMKDAKAIVLITYNDGCPIVRNNVAAYSALKKAYADKGVEFMMLDSAVQDTREGVKKEMAEYKLDIPVLFDTNQLVGEQLGVTRTAEVIVINPKNWKIVYRGPVDDRVTYERQKAQASEHYASDALDQLLADQPVTVASRQAEGCLINFPEKAKAQSFANISYAHTIAPMIQQKCATCHQPGGIGPMPLTSYEQIKGFSPMIREVIRTKRMPPWGADPSVGKFHDDKSLSSEQIKTLVHWIEAGSPRGEGADPLKQIAFKVPDWPLGKPDLVIDVPAYDIPARGIVDYQRPFIPNPLSEPRWLKASTVKVSDRQAVHHVLTGLIRPEDAPKPGEPQEANESKWGASVGGYAVGSESVVAPKDYGTYVPTGGGIGFQNHYTPYGKATTEKTQIAWYFYKPGENPKYVMHNIAIADPSIMIGPNEQRHHEVAYLEFPKDAILFGAFPHAHYRGDSSTFSIRYPDGHEVLLLALPHYDFNWQREYTFETPVKVPAGSKLIARFTYDNSKRNPANPDPNRTVPWGDQSFDEMLYMSLRYSWVGETSNNMKAEYDQMLQANRMMGMFDDNLDGRIELAELRGKTGEGLKKNFALIDQNHDGAISGAELATALKYMAGRRNAARPLDAPPAAAPTAAATDKAAPKPVAQATPGDKPTVTASR
jgi:mono/diheme cytochrome c family protein